MTVEVTEIRYVVDPGGRITGNTRVPGDKSISHRAVILGAIAEGNTRVSNLLEGTDVLATVAAFRKMSVQIEGPESGEMLIRGVGLHGLSVPSEALDLGNSGTAMRLMTGLLAGQCFDSRLTGDRSLSRRPMRRVIDPLTLMGASIESTAQGTPPLKVRSVDRLSGIRYVLPVASAQVKSALLLAGLYSAGETCIEEPRPTRDHTERMLAGFQYPCERTDSTVCLTGGGLLRGTEIDVPADLSSAAFFIVAATIAATSRLRLHSVGINPTRTGVIEILRSMGASIETENEHEICGEPIADIVVRSAPLRGVKVPADLVPLSIDEFPILCIAAACAAGTTTIRGASELRHKESDRISSMVAGLRGLGIDTEEFDDGMSIRGGDFDGGVVNSFGDHRVAMAFCVAGLRARSPVEIRDCGNVVTSFPGFIRTASSCGLRINERR